MKTMISVVARIVLEPIAENIEGSIRRIDQERSQPVVVGTWDIRTLMPHIT